MTRKNKIMIESTLRDTFEIIISLLGMGSLIFGLFIFSLYFNI